jgi:hypothetical protein
VRLEDLVVSGVPLRVDAPALAFTPGRFGASVRVRASFAWDPNATEAGPLLVLRPDEPADQLALELQGSRLLLSRGSETLARVQVGQVAPEGWLELTRDGDRVTGRLVAGEAEHTLEALDPHPLADARPGYGSSGPRVAFRQVEVSRGPERSDRDAFDRGTLVASGDPGSRWRVAAWALEQLTQVPHANLRLVGPDATPNRAAAARRVAEGLFDVAEDPSAPDELRADARARAILAAVVSGDGQAAEALASQLVASEGAEAARARVDALSWRGDDPHGLDRLLQGWVGRVTRPTVQDAALRALDVLQPGAPQVSILRAQACTQAARNAAPAQRAALLEQALALCDEARRRGAKPVEVLEVRPECLFLLGRFAAAREGYAQLVDAKPDWYTFRQLALCCLRTGDPRAALEAAVRGLAFTKRAPKQSLVELLHTAIESCQTSNPGHAAVAYQVLMDVGALPRDDPLRLMVADLALMRRRDPVDLDLALYVHSRAGRRTLDLPAPESRPTSALAWTYRHLAEGDEPQARATLKAACAASPLVDALARVDRRLSSLR